MYPFNSMLPVPPPSTFLPRRGGCFELSPFHVKIVTGAEDCAGSLSVFPADLRYSSYCVTCAFLYSFLNSVLHYTPLKRRGPGFYHGIYPMYWRKDGTKSFGGAREMSCCCKLPVAGGYLLIHSFCAPTI